MELPTIPGISARVDVINESLSKIMAKTHVKSGKDAFIARVMKALETSPDEMSLSDY